MASDRIVLSLEDFSHSVHFASKSSTDQEQWGVKEASRARKIATMIACLYLNIATFGMSAVLGVIFVEFIAYFDSSRSEPALIESLYYGLSYGGGLFFSKFLNKCDIGLVIAVSSLIAALSCFTSGFAPSIDFLIVLVGAIPGLAVSNNLFSAYVVISWMFQKGRKLALALLTAGSAIGLVILPYVTRALVDSFFWQGTIMILGAALFLNCIPCGLVIHYSKRYFQNREVVEVTKGADVNLKCLTRSALVIFMSARIIDSMITPIEEWFIVDLGVVKGLSADAGATLLSMSGVLSFTGHCIGTVVMLIVPDAKQEFHLAYLGLAWGVSHVVISLSPVYWEILLGVVIRGLASGLSASIVPGLQMDIRGLEKYPQALALSNCVCGISSTFGGYLGGLSYDLTGSYNLVFFIAAGGSLLYTVAMIVLFHIMKRVDAYERL